MSFYHEHDDHGKQQGSDRDNTEISVFDTLVTGIEIQSILNMEVEMADRRNRLLNIAKANIEAQFDLVRRRRNRQRNESTANDILREEEWIKEFYEAFLTSRLQRALDVVDPRVDEARSLMDRLFGNDKLGRKNVSKVTTCMDGRCTHAGMFSNMGHGMGYLKKAGGSLPFYKEGREPGEIKILRKSYMAKQIEAMLTSNPSQVIYYNMDSHLGCAARKATYDLCGGPASDSGLSQDIGDKIKTFQALVVFREQLMKEGKQVSEVKPSMFSYDPHSGYMWGGLKCHLNDSGVLAEGFSKSVLQRLLDEGKIFSTQEMISDPKIATLLKKSIEHKADFRKEYADSLLNNWNSITELYKDGNGELFTLILERVKTAYRKSGWAVGEVDDIERCIVSKDILVHQAKMLLLNLVTRYSVARDSKDWPFAHHEEGLAVLHEGGFSPFDGPDAFGIFSHSDPARIVEQLKLAISLIRSLRAGDSYPSHTKLETSKEQLVAAPILVANKAVSRKISEDGWEALEAIPQGSMESFFGNFLWDTEENNEEKLSHQEMNKLLAGFFRENEVRISHSDGAEFVDRVYEVYDRLQYIINKSDELSDLVMNGNVVVSNIILDGNRMARIILPFVV